jgi:hypothetical protein
MRADGAGTRSASTATPIRFTLPSSPQALDQSLLGDAPLHVAVLPQPITADTEVLFTTGRKITVSFKALSSNTLYWRLTKCSFVL